MKYRIREPFTIKQGKDIFQGGDTIELSDAEAELHLHKLEPADEPKAKAKKADKAE